VLKKSPLMPICAPIELTKPRVVMRATSPGSAPLLGCMRKLMPAEARLISRMLTTSSRGQLNVGELLGSLCALTNWWCVTPMNGEAVRMPADAALAAMKTATPPPTTRPQE
jgi:hypothetical protein